MAPLLLRLPLMFVRLFWILTLVLSVTTGTADPWTRVPNTTLTLPQNPGRLGYRLVDGLGIAFEKPSAMAFVPGKPNALLLTELSGRVVRVANRAQPSRAVILDVVDSTVVGPNEGLLALTLHPRFESNGRIFLLRTARIPGQANAGKFVQISEFQVSPDTLEPTAPGEKVLIQQGYSSLDHLGGDLQFGPDGYLYASIGDGFNPAFNSQQIDRGFFSAVLRIDVDERPGSLAPNPHPAVKGGYRIPPDNPYVGATQFLGAPVDPSEVRTELWSVGFREPFRLSFDSATGELYVGEVGAEARESVHVTSPGANHGWPYREGDTQGILFDTVPQDFLYNPLHRYVPPVFSYPHTVGHCVIGGVIYRGSRFPDLYGAYLISDYSYGWMGTVRPNAQGVRELKGLSLYLPGVTDFAEDPLTGDIWISEIDQSRLWRLEYSGVFTGEPLPATLADTGAFTDLTQLTPAPGIIPYEVNHAFWSDDAHKRRWLSVPALTNQVGFHPTEGWTSPAGTVWIKHFDLELTPGVPESSRRIETRFLVRQPDGVYGLSYRWDSATNATLVPEDGVEENITRVVNGVSVVQRWRYPSRSECLACHNRRSGLALSFNTAQLNREVEWDGVRTHQIAALVRSGYLTNAPASFHATPKYAARDDADASLEWRARSYLSANCSFCHQPGGAGLGRFDARFMTPTDLAGLLGGALINDRGDPANRVLQPGDLAHSVILQRIAVRGPDQMPPLASHLEDIHGTDLLESWVLEAGQGPVPEPDVRLRAESHSGELLLHLTQPANRAIRLERATRLTNPDWTPVDAPGAERVFPAKAREVTVTPPSSGTPEQPAFYRILTESP